MECTCADNSLLPPMVIYKGKGLYRGWFTEINDQNAEFAHFSKGYILTDNLAIEGCRPLMSRRKSMHEVSHGFSLWMAIGP